MKHSALTNMQHPFFNLYAIAGGQADSSTTPTDTAWLFAYSSLWNNLSFSETEKSQTKSLIAGWLKGKNPRKAFVHFCQQIILARLHIQSLQHQYLALPSIWFDPETTEGYATIKDWLDEIRAIRSSVPDFKIEIKALAEAVLELSEEPTTENFLYWRQYFIEKEEPVLLNLFTVFAANLIYKIQ